MTQLVGEGGGGGGENWQWRPFSSMSGEHGGDLLVVLISNGEINQQRRLSLGNKLQDDHGVLYSLECKEVITTTRFLYLLLPQTVAYATLWSEDPQLAVKSRLLSGAVPHCQNPITTAQPPKKALVDGCTKILRARCLYICTSKELEWRGAKQNLDIASLKESQLKDARERGSMFASSRFYQLFANGSEMRGHWRVDHHTSEDDFAPCKMPFPNMSTERRIFTSCVEFVKILSILKQRMLEKRMKFHLTTDYETEPVFMIQAIWLGPLPRLLLLQCPTHMQSD
ncbi:unnamed protein product [Hymenolepis diminuta]|uniref:Uncharacterized protein n=1 Tax=Hymenolepis diminuta TaxID=6216 RepID=A0A158QG88_HYMDI|nr:unnamed protein product [Hymenolepis diminuta]